MLDLSSYKTVTTSSSLSTSSGRRVFDGVIADGYVRCVRCRSVVDRRHVDFLLRCEPCQDERCDRCRAPLATDGTCIVCLEVQVGTDMETDARRERGLADAVGNQTRPEILTEEDEFHAYSGGVCEYDVTDEKIAAIRRVDQFNEDRREWRAQKTKNGVCSQCGLELALVERRAGIHPDCEE